jgi:hypothetical protein
MSSIGDKTYMAGQQDARDDGVGDASPPINLPSETKNPAKRKQKGEPEKMFVLLQLQHWSNPKVRELYRQDLDDGIKKVRVGGYDTYELWTDKSNLDQQAKAQTIFQVHLFERFGFKQFQFLLIVGSRYRNGTAPSTFK